MACLLQLPKLVFWEVSLLPWNHYTTSRSPESAGVGDQLKSIDGTKAFMFVSEIVYTLGLHQWSPGWLTHTHIYFMVFLSCPLTLSWQESNKSIDGTNLTHGSSLPTFYIPHKGTSYGWDLLSGKE